MIDALCIELCVLKFSLKSVMLVLVGTDWVGSGKHCSNCYQDPPVACPTMAGRKFRTTLIGDGEQWLVMELCEPLESMIDLSAEFHGYVLNSRRDKNFISNF